MLAGLLVMTASSSCAFILSRMLARREAISSGEKLANESGGADMIFKVSCQMEKRKVINPLASGCFVSMVANIL